MLTVVESSLTREFRRLTSSVISLMIVVSVIVSSLRAAQCKTWAMFTTASVSWGHQKHYDWTEGKNEPSALREIRLILRNEKSWVNLSKVKNLPHMVPCPGWRCTHHWFHHIRFPQHQSDSSSCTQKKYADQTNINKNRPFFILKMATDWHLATRGTQFEKGSLFYLFFYGKCVAYQKFTYLKTSWTMAVQTIIAFCSRPSLWAIHCCLNIYATNAW